MYYIIFMRTDMDVQTRINDTDTHMKSSKQKSGVILLNIFLVLECYIVKYIAIRILDSECYIPTRMLYCGIYS